MNRQKELREKAIEQVCIENLTFEQGRDQNYNKVQFELGNNITFEIVSKFNSEAVVDYVLNNNLRDLEAISKESLPGDSKIDLRLLFDTFSNYNKDSVIKDIELMHLFSGYILINRANKKVDDDYTYALEDYLKRNESTILDEDRFECIYEDDKSIRINLIQYPNDMIHSLSEAIKGMVEIYEAIIIYNAKYGIEDYDFEVFIDAHEM